ncbi:DUF805 domain-containing protein [uncultured Parasphingopyxis sp.]|uniref:DUF805 domain-containing protein n=1 Tax=uncultured Parasphingopyxis sp. TaxID=1547918 RepID=UPI00261BA6E9|nr:DUF805 domain-containing protein [uncultured Parasphingopyxis sp.]
MILPLERYAEFSGRSRRTEFFMFGLFQLLVAIAIGGVILAIGGEGYGFPNYDPTIIWQLSGHLAVAHAINWIVSVSLIVPNIAVTVRRLHDVDRSGWWASLLALPIFLIAAGATGIRPSIAVLWVVSMVSYLALLIFMVSEGTDGPNRFGANPRHIDA